MSEPSTPASGGSVVVGTWNVSWWCGARFEPVRALGVSILALQETKLARVPVEHACGEAAERGYALHHGRPVPTIHSGVHGNCRGVGFLVARGVAVSQTPPQGPAWLRLHAMQRLHAVSLPPRPGLPLGLRLFTVYAPLRRDPCHAAFTAAFLDLLFELDLSVPTLFMGDFNGSVLPARDYSRGGGAVCPLLARLLGPSAPLLDLQLLLSPDAHTWTFRGHTTEGQPYCSRCDLILGNRAVVPLVRRIFVRADVLDGGHSPVLAELCLDSPLTLEWRAPRPRLPALLLCRSRDLYKSTDWEEALVAWRASPEWH